eukprot:c26490_g1_i2 orf=663-2615(-)
MGAGRGSFETAKRASRTVLFMMIMVGSLLVTSAPLLVSLVDVISPCVLLSTFTCCTTCFGRRQDWTTYSFRTSLLDIPLLSLVRSLAIFCAYSVCGIPTFTYGPYVATAAICGLISTILLIVKASLFSLSFDGAGLPASVLTVRHGWGMPSLFLSSMVLALGHIVVAYRTRCQARRKLHFYRLDHEAVLVYKVAFNGCQKFPCLASMPHPAKINKVSISEGKFCAEDERDLPARMLADKDSLFMLCEGLFVHYKKNEACSTFKQISGKEYENTTGRHPLQNVGKRNDNLVLSSPKENHPCNTSSDSLSLYTPLLSSSGSGIDLLPLDSAPPVNNGWHRIGRQGLKLDSLSSRQPKPGRVEAKSGKQNAYCKGIVLIHGFGGGVFSWRHVMQPLAVQVGCMVAAFDRPGWGLTSRPSSADWKSRGASNPYELQSQVDLLFAFCRELHLTSVVLVGHDDGGLLALMAAATSRSKKALQVEILGVVLVGVSLSREVVPAFARVLLHTSLGRHMLRPLLRTEIAQVANRRAWHNASMLTSDVLDLYRAPLRVEGWDKALVEVSKASTGVMFLSSSATELVKSLQDLPALIVAGVQDILVPLKSAKALAVQLPHSRLVAIQSCGHLPHEESPEALLSALIPFIIGLQRDITLAPG